MFGIVSLYKAMEKEGSMTDPRQRTGPAPGAGGFAMDGERESVLARRRLALIVLVAAVPVLRKNLRRLRRLSAPAITKATGTRNMAMVAIHMVLRSVCLLGIRALQGSPRGLGRGFGWL